MPHVHKFISLIPVVCLFAGCDFLSVKEQQEKSATFCEISGTVKHEHSIEGGLVLVLLRHKSGTVNHKKNWTLVDHYLLDQPGHWLFISGPGTYLVTAFQDTNNNRVFERNEPAIPLDYNKVFSCKPGETLTGFNLTIPDKGRIPGEEAVNISKLQVRSITEQLNVSLGQAVAVGTTINLEDPRFSRENADKGLWKPFDFIWESKPGIYFLQPYDPNKIPVLFVHGIKGSPIEFSYFIDHIDQSVFQPWVAYFPSGAHLEKIADYLNRIINQLKAKHHFQKMHVIAHSMGGLVARSMILNHHETYHDSLYSTFITIATPWNGYRAAQLAVDHSPIAVYSWLDMAPDSQFLTRLFYAKTKNQRRQLAFHITHHLIFGYLDDDSGDGTISLKSQLRQEAQDDAAHLYGVLQSHTGSLNDSKVSALVNKLLLGGAEDKLQH